MPAVEAAKLIVPVTVSAKTRPDGVAEKTPADTVVGVGLAALVQKALAGYAKAALWGVSTST